MNKSVAFKRAHALTRITVQAGDSYAVTFAAALRIIIDEMTHTARRIAFAVSKGILKGWNDVRAYADDSNMAVITPFHNNGIQFNKAFVDMKTGEFCFVNLRGYGSFALAEKMGVRGVAKFSGSDAEMYEEAVRTMKAWMNAEARRIAK